MLVAFYNAATRRIFFHLKLLTKGGGAAKEAVKAGLCEMLTHPDWGIPGALYTDQGNEMSELDTVLADLALADRCPVIRAAPRNPQAKPIEGVFANLNRLVFSKMSGFTGGKPHTLRNLLSETERPSYPGSWAKFVREFTPLLDDYHRTRRSGPCSPQALYEKKRREMNHTPQTLSMAELTFSLGEVQTRRIR